MLTPPQAGAVWPLPTSVARVPGLLFPATSLDFVSRGLTFQPDQLKGLGRAPSTLSSLFLSFPPSLLSSRPQEATLRGADPSVSPALFSLPLRHSAPSFRPVLAPASAHTRVLLPPPPPSAGRGLRSQTGLHCAPVPHAVCSFSLSLHFFCFSNYSKKNLTQLFDYRLKQCLCGLRTHMYVCVRILLSDPTPELSSDTIFSCPTSSTCSRVSAWCLLPDWGSSRKQLHFFM